MRSRHAADGRWGMGSFGRTRLIQRNCCKCNNPVAKGRISRPVKRAFDYFRFRIADCRLPGLIVSLLIAETLEIRRKQVYSAQRLFGFSGVRIGAV